MSSESKILQQLSEIEKQMNESCRSVDYGQFGPDSAFLYFLEAGQVFGYHAVAERLGNLSEEKTETSESK